MRAFLVYTLQLFLGLTIFVSGGPLWAMVGTQNSDCDWALLSQQDMIRLTVSQARREFEDRIGASDKPSVRLNLEGRQNYVLLERIEGRSWFSAAAPFGMEAASSGDPRDNFAIFGPNTLEYLGLKVVSKDILQYPRPHYLEDRLGKLSRQLEMMNLLPLAVRLTCCTTPDDLVFLKNFHDNQSLPIEGPEVSELLYAHDLFVHMAAILLPNSYMEYFRERLRFDLEFVDYLNEQGLGSKARTVLQKRAQDLDSGSADIAEFFLRFEPPSNGGYFPSALSGRANFKVLDLIGARQREDNYSDSKEAFTKYITDHPELRQKYPNYFSQQEYSRRVDGQVLLKGIQVRQQEIEKAATALLQQERLREDKAVDQ